MWTNAIGLESAIPQSGQGHDSAEFTIQLYLVLYGSMHV